jgi:hypothetical protein
MKELKTQPVLKKTTITNKRRYNVLVEWTDLDSSVLVLNTNQQERGTQAAR